MGLGAGVLGRSKRPGPCGPASGEREDARGWVRGVGMSSGLSIYILGPRGASLWVRAEPSKEREGVPGLLFHWLLRQDPLPPPCALDAATRLALGSTGAGCQQDGRWTEGDQVSEVGANSLHSCPAPPPLASRALLGPWCPQSQSFPSFSQDPELLAPRKGDLMCGGGGGRGQGRGLRAPGCYAGWSQPPPTPENTGD